MGFQVNNIIFGPFYQDRSVFKYIISNIPSVSPGNAGRLLRQPMVLA